MSSSSESFPVESPVESSPESPSAESFTEDDFPQFSRLPPELRLMIWEEAAMLPRLIPVKYLSLTTHQDCRLAVDRSTPALTPVMGACREAYEAVTGVLVRGRDAAELRARVWRSNCIHVTLWDEPFDASRMLPVSAYRFWPTIGPSPSVVVEEERLCQLRCLLEFLVMRARFLVVYVGESDAAIADFEFRRLDNLLGICSLYPKLLAPPYYPQPVPPPRDRLETMTSRPVRPS